MYVPDMKYLYVAMFIHGLDCGKDEILLREFTKFLEKKLDYSTAMLWFNLIEEIFDNRNPGRCEEKGEGVEKEKIELLKHLLDEFYSNRDALKFVLR